MRHKQNGEIINLHSEGAGYVLCRETLLRLGSYLKASLLNCPNTGIEDVDVASCLAKLNVNQGRSLDEDGKERFHPLKPEKHINGDFPKWLSDMARNPLMKVNFKFLIKNQISI